MPKVITPDEFNKLMKKSFRYLENEFSFSVRKVNDWTYVAETPDTRIYIYIEHYAILVVEIEPIGEQANQLLRQNILPSRADIVPMSKYYNPKLNYKPEMLDKKNYIHNIPIEIEKRATLLKTYFTKMLRGDFSDWPKMEKYLP